MPVGSVRRATAVVGVLAGLAATGLVAAPSAQAASLTFTVNTDSGAVGTAGDGVCDTSTATGDQCTLREAIAESNAAPGRDTIGFAITLVRQTSAGFPAITDPVTVSGSGTRLDGASLGLDGLVVADSAPGTVIRGLTMTRFANAVVLQGDGNTVAGTFLGVPATGSSSVLGNRVGILVRGGSANVIGGTTTADRNVIGRNNTGISIEGADPSGQPTAGEADGNTLLGNWIGLRADGTVAALNTYGVQLSGALATTIGSTAAPNTISGNAVGVSEEGSAGTVVRGNRVGTNPAGTAAVGNATGLELFYTGPATLAQNTIAGNTDYGVSGAGPVDLTLSDNVIGLNAAGTARIANQYGVYVAADSGTVTMSGNTVAGSTLDGVYLQNVDLAVSRNVVGTPTTLKTLANAGDGLSLQDVTGLVTDNVVSGNGADGLDLVGSSDVTVTRNRIGTNAAGTAAVGNTADGVRLCETSDTTVGGAAADANLVSGNGGAGIHLTCQSTENTVRGNVVGRAANTTSAIPNAGDGLALDDNADRNEIAENTIASNGGNGVVVDYTSNSNRITANALTANAGLGIDLGADDVTDNDQLDRDAGANALQNFPVLTRAGSDAMSTAVRGTLATRASGSYRLDFYASPTCDASGYGEGATWLGSSTVTTGTTGTAAFDATLPTPLAAGQQVTATATDVRREDTSEFSACRASVAFPSATVDDVTVAEPASGTTTAAFTVTLSAPAPVAASLRARTVAGSATAGSDFTAVDTVVSFAAGASIATVAVPIAGEGVEEVTEGFTVELSQPDALTIADGTGQGTITDTSAPLTVSIDDVIVSEPTTGTSVAALSVRLSRATLKPVTVAYATASGTAGGYDYSAKSGTLVIPVGATSATVSVSVKADAIDEADETFAVGLTSATNATIADAQGAVTILDTTPTPTVSVNDVTTIEGAAGTTTAFVFTLTLSGKSSASTTVRYATANGTALAPTDYTARSGVVTFSAGSLTKTVTITVKGDALVEADEDFTVALSTPTGVLLGDALGLGTIGNDDQAS